MTFTHLIKIGNDLVKQPQTLDTLIVAIQFHVELMIVGDRRKHNANTRVALMVEVLRQSVLCCAHAEGRNCAHTRWGEVVGAQAHIGGERQSRTRGECGISITNLVQWTEHSALQLTYTGKHIQRQTRWNYINLLVPELFF